MRICAVVVFICTIQAHAQEYKFGKVSKEELLEKAYPLDETANAAVLYENKQVAVEYIPYEGYQVIQYPKSGVFKLPENIGKFAFRSAVNNGMVQLFVNQTINSAVIPADYYLALKELYNQIIQKENEQVVLKKI